MTRLSLVTAPGPSLVGAVRDVLHNADEALICCAFAQPRGVHLVALELADVVRRSGVVRVLLTTSFGSTSPNALAAIQETGAEVRLLNPSGGTYHPKVFVDTVIGCGPWSAQRI